MGINAYIRLLGILVFFGLQSDAHTPVSPSENVATTQHSALENADPADPDGNVSDQDDVKSEKKSFFSHYRKQFLAAGGCFVGAAAIFLWKNSARMAAATRLFSASRNGDSNTSNQGHEQDACVPERYAKHRLSYYIQNPDMLNKPPVTLFQGGTFLEYTDDPELNLKQKNRILIESVRRNSAGRRWVTRIKAEGFPLVDPLSEDDALLISNYSVYKHPDRNLKMYHNIITRSYLEDHYFDCMEVLRFFVNRAAECTLDSFDYIIISRGYNNEYTYGAEDLVKNQQYRDKVYILPTADAVDLYNTLVCAAQKTLLLYCPGFPPHMQN